MNTRQNMKSSSSIEQQIQSIYVPQHERNQVLHAARVAEAFVGAIVWAGTRIQQFGVDVLARPSPKY